LDLEVESEPKLEAVPAASKRVRMAERIQKSWARKHVEEALVHGFQRAYHTVKVEPDRFLLQLRAAYDLPITSFDGVYFVEFDVIDSLAERIVRSGMKIAAIEGAGLGLGGMITAIPDLSILATITLRTVQKLSLLYGFEFNTAEETTELWIAAASAAGVDISRELLEKEVVSRFVPRVIRRIAIQASAEVVDKWAGRLIPVASSVIGAGLNYFFVRAWGERARAHFRQRHLEVRRGLEIRQLAAPAMAAAPPIRS
jgi:EcsC protein family